METFYNSRGSATTDVIPLTGPSKPSNSVEVRPFTFEVFNTLDPENPVDFCIQ
ncbi:hypothetical protein Pint_06730 [Pistacia integerrima]|uniref:Uncharacterized protein n=1 Tax=Pistacia integerrima TaxID=434235 RepID=A0ACC0XVY4_9ROSI|nr:hypothetical protein Pint_06730 [Pistacia integerrima]